MFQHYPSLILCGYFLLHDIHKNRFKYQASCASRMQGLQHKSKQPDIRLVIVMQKDWKM